MWQMGNADENSNSVLKGFEAYDTVLWGIKSEDNADAE